MADSQPAPAKSLNLYRLLAFLPGPLLGVASGFYKQISDYMPDGIDDTTTLVLLCIGLMVWVIGGARNMWMLAKIEKLAIQYRSDPAVVQAIKDGFGVAGTLAKDAAIVAATGGKSPTALALIAKDLGSIWQTVRGAIGIGKRLQTDAHFTTSPSSAIPAVVTSAVPAAEVPGLSQVLSHVPSQVLSHVGFAPATPPASLSAAAPMPLQLATEMMSAPQQLPRFTATTMGSDFSSAIEIIMPMEGGLSSDPQDPGGLTKYGISLRAHPELGEQGIRNLTIDQAKAIYWHEYWLKPRCEAMPPYLRLALFDACINQGVTEGVRELQRILGVEADGIVGPKTIAAAIAAPEKDLLAKYLAARALFYTSLSEFSHDGRGWLLRLFEIALAQSNAMPKTDDMALQFRRNP